MLSRVLEAKEGDQATALPMPPLQGTVVLITQGRLVQVLAFAPFLFAIYIMLSRVRTGGRQGKSVASQCLLREVGALLLLTRYRGRATALQLPPSDRRVALGSHFAHAVQRSIERAQ